MFTHESLSTVHNDLSRTNNLKMNSLIKSPTPSAIIQRARMNPQSLSHTDVMQLQKALGNRGVYQFLQEIGYQSSNSVQKNKNIMGLATAAPMQKKELSKKQSAIQAKEENTTGMSDNLKSGVESLSGIDMSDVKVHYNSSKPKGFGALAYTQGTNIHIAPGQEKNLPHEAWHVVQQKQGRVQPNMQMKGVGVNDDAGLEKEATEMGGRAARKQYKPSVKNIQESAKDIHGQKNNKVNDVYQLSPVIQMSNEGLMLAASIIAVSLSALLMWWCTKSKSSHIKLTENKIIKPPKRRKPAPKTKETTEPTTRKINIGEEISSIKVNLASLQSKMENLEEAKNKNLQWLTKNLREEIEKLLISIERYISQKMVFLNSEQQIQETHISDMRVEIAEYLNRISKLNGDIEPTVLKTKARTSTPEAASASASASGSREKGDHESKKVFKYDDCSTWSLKPLRYAKGLDPRIFDAPELRVVIRNISAFQQNGNGPGGTSINQANTRLHAHLLGGTWGISFIYLQTPGTSDVTPIIYDFADKRTSDNKYVWQRGGTAYTSPASYE